MELFGIIFDLGGILSLVATFVIFALILWKFKIYNKISTTIDELKNTYPLRVFPVLILLLIAFVSLWLTLRVIGVFVIKRYILEVNYMYKQEDIFLMLTYLLTANLCLTLLRALTPKDKGKTQDESEATKGLISVAIQAVIIGLITFVSRHNLFTKDFSDSASFMLIILSMLASIVVLIFARKYVR